MKIILLYLISLISLVNMSYALPPTHCPLVPNSNGSNEQILLCDPTNPGTGIPTPWPAGTPAVLQVADYWNRCTNEANPSDEYISDCIQLTRDMGQCVDSSVRQWAIDHAIGIVCAGNMIHSACPCSCFEEKTKILTYSEGFEEWLQVTDVGKGKQVAALSLDSTLGFIQLNSEQVSYQTSGPEETDLYVIKTKDYTIKVTQNHAMLLSSGVMIAAKYLSEDDILIDYLGNPQPILEIGRESTEKDVYNFLVEQPLANEMNHIIVAEGLLVGDMQWQNFLQSELGSVIVRQ